MLSEPPYQLFADVVLLLHFAVVVFVVGGLVLIIAGNVRGWYWVNVTWFRVAHLGAIGVVAVEAWLGVNCPLTTLEIWLRAKAGRATYSASFIEHWLQRLLFYEASSWVFVLGYSVFGLLVLSTWWYFPPRSKKRRNEGSA
jgi:polyferredoxin